MQNPRQSVITVILPYLLRRPRSASSVRGVAVVVRGRPVATVRKASAMRGTV